jgi:rhamnosyltransferase
MRRVALFAHYDGQDEVKRYIVHLVAELRRVCDEVVFLSTAKLSDREVTRARAVADRVVLCENRGFDFGMWKAGLSLVDLGSLDELVLANSSVFGPLRPLSATFSYMEGKPCDFWGMTDSEQIAWHLQSYFLVFRKPILAGDALTRFFASVLPYTTKDQVIRSYEIGLSTWLVEQGYRGAARVPFPTLARGGYGNPSVTHAAEVLDRGVPFVKVEVLRDNPERVALRPIRARMVELGYDPTLVQFDRPSRRLGDPLLRRISDRLRGRS